MVAVQLRPVVAEVVTAVVAGYRGGGSCGDNMSGGYGDPVDE